MRPRAASAGPPPACRRGPHPRPGRSRRPSRDAPAGLRPPRRPLRRDGGRGRRPPAALGGGDQRPRRGRPARVEPPDAGGPPAHPRQRHDVPRPSPRRHPGAPLAPRPHPVRHRRGRMGPSGTGGRPARPRLRGRPRRPLRPAPARPRGRPARGLAPRESRLPAGMRRAAAAGGTLAPPLCRRPRAGAGRKLVGARRPHRGAGRARVRAREPHRRQRGAAGRAGGLEGAAARRHVRGPPDVARGERTGTPGEPPHRRPDAGTGLGELLRARVPRPLHGLRPRRGHRPDRPRLPRVHQDAGGAPAGRPDPAQSAVGGLRPAGVRGTVAERGARARGSGAARQRRRHQPARRRRRAVAGPDGVPARPVPPPPRRRPAAAVGGHVVVRRRGRPRARARPPRRARDQAGLSQRAAGTDVRPAPPREAARPARRSHRAPAPPLRGPGAGRVVDDPGPGGRRALPALPRHPRLRPVAGRRLRRAAGGAGPRVVVDRLPRRDPARRRQQQGRLGSGRDGRAPPLADPVQRVPHRRQPGHVRPAEPGRRQPLLAGPVLRAGGGRGAAAARGDAAALRGVVAPVDGGAGRRPELPHRPRLRAAGNGHRQPPTRSRPPGRGRGDAVRIGPARRPALAGGAPAQRGVALARPPLGGLVAHHQPPRVRSPVGPVRPPGSQRPAPHPGPDGHDARELQRRRQRGHDPGPRVAPPRHRAPARARTAGAPAPAARADDGGRGRTRPHRAPARRHRQRDHLPVALPHLAAGQSRRRPPAARRRKPAGRGVPARSAEAARRGAARSPDAGSDIAGIEARHRGRRGRPARRSRRAVRGARRPARGADGAARPGPGGSGRPVGRADPRLSHPRGPGPAPRPPAVA